MFSFQSRSHFKKGGKKRKKEIRKPFIPVTGGKQGI